jgi:hypothetical protein
MEEVFETASRQTQSPRTKRGSSYASERRAMRFGRNTEVTANCDGGVQSGALASLVQARNRTGLQLRAWQRLSQQATDFRERFAGIAGGALDAGPKQEYEAVGCLPRCEWFCQTDAKGLIVEEGPPG